MPGPEPLGKKVGTVERQPAKNMPYTCGKYNFITEFSVGRYNMPSFGQRPDVHHDFGTLKPRYSGALFFWRFRQGT